MNHRWRKIKIPPFDPGEYAEWNTSDYSWQICENCNMIIFSLRRIDDGRLVQEGYYINQKLEPKFMSCNEVIMKDVLE